MEASIGATKALGDKISTVILDLTHDFIEGKFGDEEVQEIWLEIFYVLDDSAVLDNIQSYDLRSRLLITLMLIQLQDFSMYPQVFSVLSDPEIGISGGPWYYFVMEIVRYYLIYVVEQCKDFDTPGKWTYFEEKVSEVEVKLNTPFARHSFLRTKLTPILLDISNLLDTIILDPVSNDDESKSEKEFYYIYAYKGHYNFEKFVPKILIWILHLLQDINANMQQRQQSPKMQSPISSSYKKNSMKIVSDYIEVQDSERHQEIPLTQTFIISKRKPEITSGNKRKLISSSSKHLSDGRKQQKRNDIYRAQEPNDACEEHYDTFEERYDMNNPSSSWASPEYHSVTDAYEVENAVATDDQSKNSSVKTIASYLLDTIYKFYFENDANV